jgi:hypothetical protein
LIAKSGGADVVRVGPERRPGSVNDFLQGVDMRWLNLTRDAVPVGAGGHLPAGLDARYLLWCRFEGISCFEHAVGFRAAGLVRCQFHDCAAFRSRPGRADLPFRGFWLDGMEDIGLAGGNASLFLIGCNASIGGAPQVSDPVGLLLDGGFADTFIVDFETSAIATGIRAAGRARELGPRATAAHANLHIRMPIIDQCSAVGIEILDTSDHAQIDIAEPYVAVAHGARAGIRFGRVRGSISIANGQLHGRTDASASGVAIGLEAHDSRGLNVTGLKLLDYRRPIRLASCRGLALQGWIGNPTQAGETAVELDTCAQGSVAMQVTGHDAAFPAGITVTGRPDSLRVDIAAIDPAALSGGEAARLNLAGRPLTEGRYQGLAIDGA